MTEHKLISLSSLTEDKIYSFEVNNKSLILIKNGLDLSVFDAACPHQGASLANGHLENNKIVCPLHGRTFSCSDGKNSEHNSNLNSYPTLIKNDEVFVIIRDEKNESNTTKKIIESKDLPTPKGKFILGNLPEFNAENKHQILENWVNRENNIVQISLMGKKFIVSGDESINTEILKQRPDNFRRYHKMEEIMEEMSVNGVFGKEGEEWKKHRKITQEALNLKNVKSFFPTLEKMTNRLHKRWNTAAKNNTAIDIQKEMMRYTVDITTFIAFGYDSNTLEKDNDLIQNHLSKIFPMINKRITAPLPLWRFIKSKQDKELDAAINSLEKVITEFINEARKRRENNTTLKENPSNFLEALLTEQEKDSSFSDNDIFGNVFTMLLAGEDTTSNSISWTLYFLATHPKCFTKVREEADQLTSNIVINDVNLLPQLRYTEAVCTESMRIKPTTPTLYMQANHDITVEHLHLKKGETVMLQNKVAQTDEKNFSNPDEFKPERWLETCPHHRNHKPEALRVFGGGPRYCPGKNLAMHEMLICISMIAKNFDIELAVSPDEIKESFAFTMYPKNLLINLKMREKS